MATHHTVLFVHTEETPTLWTRPTCSFSCDKFVNPDLANRLKVLDHTHAILRSVALVELLQSLAGERLTVTAERLSVS